MRLVDLTNPMSIHSPGWVGYPAPKLWYIQQHHTNGIVSQMIETPLHIGTHLDSEMHGVSGGKDIAAIPLERLVHEGVIVDVSEIGEWGIYTPELIESKVEVKQGDILIIHTGWYKYYAGQEKEDVVTYFLKHPGPNKQFAEWAIEKELSWIGVDCGSADHALNTSIRFKRPDMVKEFESSRQVKLEEVFPEADLFVMHHEPFRHGIVHAENVGGDIARVLNTRCLIGAFPWRFEGAEAGICRIVAFLDE
ncbi:cyclase family protein [Candidatus Formimonas warabiya]|uniref:Cyclase family protein n=1 Tax=Formimonas warabiya TaxID=1761012 RepID=A0A3G1KZC9_FORW1|nr:cyclase family protein [Candidatus Formimonas warabiya]ATW27770.1 hypothetical protein DCMF_26155 [Candidatus Formimonas warabiya]